MESSVTMVWNCVIVFLVKCAVCLEISSHYSQNQKQRHLYKGMDRLCLAYNLELDWFEAMCHQIRSIQKCRLYVCLSIHYFYVFYIFWIHKPAMVHLNMQCSSQRWNSDSLNQCLFYLLYILFYPYFPRLEESTYHVDSILVKGVPLHVLRVTCQNFWLESPLQRALLEVFTWTQKKNRQI